MLTKGRILLLFAIVIITLMPVKSYPLSISGNIDISYTQKKSTTSGDSINRSQRYYINLGFNRILTSTIGFSGDLGIRISKVDDSETEDYLPQFNLRFTPPPYYNTTVNIGYNRIDSDIEETNWITNDYWTTSLSVAPPSFPSLSLSYTLNRTYDHEDTPIVKTTSSTLGATASYDIPVLGSDVGLTYSFYNTGNKDEVNDTTTESPIHSVNASVSRSFWEDKLTFSGSVGWKYSKAVTESSKPTQFSREKEPINALYGIDSTPGDGVLTVTGSLMDKDMSNQALDSGGNPIDLNDPDRNLALEFAESEYVDKLFLYIATSNLQLENLSFGFEIYSSGDGITWSMVTASPSVSYTTSLNGRGKGYEINFSRVKTKFIKVVNAGDPVTGSGNVYIAELGAEGIVSEIETARLENIATSANGSLNIGFSPYENLNFSYNLSYAQNESEFNVSQTSDTTTLGQGVSMDATAIPSYLNVSASYTTNRTNTNVGQDTGTDSYNLSLNSTVLPTLNGNLTYSHSSSLAEGEVKSRSDSVGAAVFMGIYEGIDVRFSNLFSRSKQLDTNAESDSSSHRMQITMIPWANVQIITRGIQSYSKTGGISSSTGTLDTSIIYSPNQSVYISVNYDVAPAFSQHYYATWHITKTIDTNFSYGLTDDSTDWSANVNWTPLRRFTLIFRYSEVDADDDRNSTLLLRGSLSL